MKSSSSHNLLRISAKPIPTEGRCSSQVWPADDSVGPRTRVPGSVETHTPLEVLCLKCPKSFPSLPFSHRTFLGVTVTSVQSPENGSRKRQTVAENAPLSLGPQENWGTGTTSTVAASELTRAAGPREPGRRRRTGSEGSEGEAPGERRSGDPGLCFPSSRHPGDGAHRRRENHLGRAGWRLRRRGPGQAARSVLRPLSPLAKTQNPPGGGRDGRAAGNRGRTGNDCSRGSTA